ncbi:hypothetical protein D3C87_1669090 [compost metagenome]
MAEEVFGLSTVTLVSVDASKSGCIDIQLGKGSLDVADDVVMVLASEIGNLPTRHGDRIAWSDDRVHNGPSSVFRFEEAGLQPGFFVPVIQAL